MNKSEDYGSPSNLYRIVPQLQHLIENPAIQNRHTFGQDLQFIRTGKRSDITVLNNVGNCLQN